MSGFTHYKIETNDQRVESFPTQRSYSNFRNDEYKVQVTSPIVVEQVVVTDQTSYSKILEAKEREITNLRESVKSLNNQISDYLKELEMWKSKYRQLQSEKGTSKITTFQSNQNNDWELQQLREEVNRLRQDGNDSKTKNMVKIGSDDFEVNSLKQQIKQLQDELRSKGSVQSVQVSALTLPNNADQFKEQIKKLRAENDDLIKANNLLNQQMSQSKLQLTFRGAQDDGKIKIKLYEDKIAEQQQEIQRLNYNCDSYIQEIQQSQLRFGGKNQNSEIEGYLRRISALQHEVLQWQDRCRALELQLQSSDTEQRVGQKDNQILFLQERIKQYELQIDQFRMEIEKSKKEIDGFRTTYDSRKSDTAEVESLRRKVAEMEQDILILIADLQERDQRISITQNEYEEEIKMLKNQGQTQYQQELSSWREEKERMKMEFERLSNDYMIIQRQSDQFKNGSFELDSLRQRIIELETQLRNQSSQYQAMQGQYQSLQMQYQGSQQQSQSSYQLTTIKEDYSKLQSQYGQMQFELQSLRDQSSKYKYDYEQIYSELMQLKQQKSSLEKNSYQYVNIQNDYQGLQDRYNQSLDEIQQLNEQIRKYRSDYDSLNQNYLVFQRESETKYGQSDQLRSRISQQEQQISQLRQQLQLQESSLEQQFMERLRVERYQLEQKVSQQGLAELGQLKTQYDQLQLRYNECQSELKVAKENTTRQSQFESQNLRDQLQQLRQINLQLNSEIMSLKESISKYRSDYDQVNQHFILLQRESESQKTNTTEVDRLTSRLRELDFELQSKNKLITRLQMDLQNQANQIKSELEQQFVSRLTIERSNLENRLQQQGSQEIQSLQYQLQQTQSELNQFRQRYSQIEQQYNQTKIEITQIRQQYSMKESQMVSSDQVKKYQVRITELEHEIQTLNVEIERQKNIRSEQENKIQVLITNITDYESRLHILEQENARLENKLKRSQIVIDKPVDQYIVNQLIGQTGGSQLKREIVTTTTTNVNRQSGMNQAYGQSYFDQQQQRLQSQNEGKQSQFGRMLSPQPQVSNYLSPDKYQQTQKITTTKSVKQAIMSSANQG